MAQNGQVTVSLISQPCSFWGFQPMYCAKATFYFTAGWSNGIFKLWQLTNIEDALMHSISSTILLICGPGQEP